MWQPIKRRGERFLTDLISTLALLTCGFYYGTSHNQRNNSEKSCKTTSTHTNRTPSLIQHNAASFQTSYTTNASWLHFLWIQSPTRSFRVFWIRCLSLQQFQKIYRCALKQVKSKVKRFFGSNTTYLPTEAVVSDRFGCFWPAGNPRSLTGSWARSGHCFLKEIRPCQNSRDAPVAFISSATEYEIGDCHRRQLYNASCKHNPGLGVGWMSAATSCSRLNWQWSFCECLDRQCFLFLRHTVNFPEVIQSNYASL